MRAARFHNVGSPLRLESVPVPELVPGEVLVKIAGVGVCRSDLHIIEGRYDVALPLIPRSRASRIEPEPVRSSIWSARTKRFASPPPSLDRAG